MSHPAQILVVDDEPFIRLVVSNRLKAKNYTVFTCSGGQEALDWIQQHQEPDVILLDLMMPEMNGYEFLKRLRNEKKTNVPVIVFSAKAKDIEVKEALDQGAQGYLVKPFTADDLLNAISKAIA